MKKKLHIYTSMVAVILLFMFSGNLNSQTIISSVSTTKNISNKLVGIENAEATFNVNEKNWFINKNYLEQTSNLDFVRIMMIVNEQVTEKERNIEDWMLHNEKWNSYYAMEFNVEENRKIEDWMLADTFWNFKTTRQYKEIEDWMTDKGFWVLNK